MEPGSRLAQSMLGGGTRWTTFAVPWGVVNNPLPLVVVTLIEVNSTSLCQLSECLLCCRWTAPSPLPATENKLEILILRAASHASSLI